jgi:hypothetical protein
MPRPFQDELTWYDQPEEIIRRNGGFSGCDIDIVVRLPGTYDRRGRVLSSPSVYQLGSIQTLSYQSYNSKEAVRSLGFKNVRGYARGSRTIAGTLMFNQLYTHVLDDIGNRTIINDSKGILTHSSGRVTYYRNAPINPAIQEAVGEEISFESPRVLTKRHNFDFSWDQNTIGRQLKASDLPPFDIIAIFVNEYGHVGKMIIYGVDLVTEGGVLSIEDIYTEVSMQYVARDIEYFHSETQAGLRNWSGVSPFAESRPSGKETVIESFEASAETVNRSLNENTRSLWEAFGIDVPRLTRDFQEGAEVRAQLSGLMQGRGLRERMVDSVVGMQSTPTGITIESRGVVEVYGVNLTEPSSSEFPPADPIEGTRPSRTLDLISWLPDENLDSEEGRQYIRDIIDQALFSETSGSASESASYEIRPYSTNISILLSDLRQERSDRIRNPLGPVSIDRMSFNMLDFIIRYVESLQ